MRRWTNEPLLHFLMAGCLLFVAYGWLNRGVDDAAAAASRTVHITASEVDWLQQSWSRQWQREPSPDEMKGLLTDYLKEELLAREARTLGLDENDTVVRRRLAQKMEFMVQDTAQLVEPNEDELRHFYETQHERFQTPAQISFTHIYFNRDQRQGHTEVDARATLQQLSQAGTDVVDLGDRFLAQTEFADADEQAVASVLGPEFAHRIFELPVGSWQGPVESGYGLHLVRIDYRQAAQPREFAAVKGEVLTLWRQQHEEKTREEYFASLLNKYDVVMDDSIKSLIGPLAAAKAQIQ